MSNLIQRKTLLNADSDENKTTETSQEPSVSHKSSNLSEEEEMEPLPSVPSGESLPRDTANIDALDSTLKNLDPRWRNYAVRFVFTWIMIFGLCFMVYMGPLVITLLILGIQVKCFHEIITIGYVVYKSHHLPGFRTISWYFLIASNYYLYGESLIEKVIFAHFF